MLNRLIALYLTIFISLILALIFLVLFYHSSKTGQYEDTYTPSVRILFEDEELPADSASTKTEQKPNK